MSATWHQELINKENPLPNSYKKNLLFEENPHSKFQKVLGETNCIAMEINEGVIPEKEA